jgi:hypothetical protein
MVTRCAVSIGVGLVILLAGVSSAEPPPPYKVAKHERRSIEGWTVHVDVALLDGERKAIGDRALRVLGDKLFELTLMLPAKRVEELRTIPLWIDDRHELDTMQYHPAAAWLREHGYDPVMAKGVHIPNAERLVKHVAGHGQPFALLHELAHAYHDQFLGFDHPKVKEAWQAFVDSGRYERVLGIDGKHRRHYALTNHKEFFAEMTEAFIGTNDFYPFVRGQLIQAEPEIHALMTSIWLDEPSPSTK